MNRGCAEAFNELSPREKIVLPLPGIPDWESTRSCPLSLAVMSSFMAVIPVEKRVTELAPLGKKRSRHKMLYRYLRGCVFLYYGVL